MAFEIGQRVGDYEVVSALGSGGLGEVYEVRHTISQRCEAMKILLPGQIATPELAERFRREIQLLGALNHPHIAALHNAFYSDGQLIMIMELVNGETLRARSMRMRMPVPEVIRYARQILSALDYAHGRGVVHRDIKPSNIMITSENEIKLVDFGIAIGAHSAELTAPGFMLGSVNYMSPEQIAGDKATLRSDIYSVGVTLYEILTGWLPVKGSNNLEIMRSHLNDRPTAPIHLNPRLPVELSNVLLKALEKTPEGRFASALSFLAALDLIPAAAMREAFSVETTALHIPSGAPVGAVQPVEQRASGTSSQQQKSASQIAAFPLDDISRKLAVYIGPIATVVVRKLAPKCTNLNQLYQEAASHIPSEKDRQKFLQSKHN
ncbi:serine/threonine protein kinase [Alloacidobacterium dinghuense]|uniref:non-specific serine/threonine protein kinase n=1 Tax=Alloacidobacterium dinghuense TaxID=2763107 RepID=A0A7G8BGW5_9BACT|nr:serine/threonine-protein kinase [Alloacidobacterium dinghuense]QNI31785.1 serine/threonine protein kinase [Alloacidobacterium dinghuense]